MLTTFDLDDYVYEALRAGASGFLLKDSPRADLIAAVRAAAAGDAMLAPSVTRRLIEAFARRPPQPRPRPSRLASLTAREREVLLLLARGSSNTEIAGALFVSEATVKTHVGNLLAKLGLRDRVQAVILAYETGIVVPGDPSGPQDERWVPLHRLEGQPGSEWPPHTLACLPWPHRLLPPVNRNSPSVPSTSQYVRDALRKDTSSLPRSSWPPDPRRVIRAPSHRDRGSASDGVDLDRGASARGGAGTRVTVAAREATARTIRWHPP